jgi:hypothetical protein
MSTSSSIANTLASRFIQRYHAQHAEFELAHGLEADQPHQGFLEVATAEIQNAFNLMGKPEGIELTDAQIDLLMGEGLDADGEPLPDAAMDSVKGLEYLYDAFYLLQDHFTECGSEPGWCDAVGCPNYHGPRVDTGE